MTELWTGPSRGGRVFITAGGMGSANSTLYVHLDFRNHGGLAEDPTQKQKKNPPTGGKTYAAFPQLLCLYGMTVCVEKGKFRRSKGKRGKFCRRILWLCIDVKQFRTLLTANRKKDKKDCLGRRRFA